VAVFKAWGRLVVKFRVLVIVLGALFMAFAAVWGTGIFGALVDGGFDDESSESWRASVVVAQEIGRDAPDLIVLVEHPTRTVDDPAYAADLQAASAVIPEDRVIRVVSFFNTGAPQFVSPDRRSTYAIVTEIHQGALSETNTDQLRAAFADRGYSVKLGGTSAVFDEISNTVGKDIGRAEAISMPILLVLLVIIFGSVVSALLPLLVGGMAILGAFTVLRVINEFTEVSIFAVNLVTIMGLGLAIDYGLLIVGRFREELAAGRSTADAVGRTVQTAGRTVAISALTVAVSLSGLTLFPMTFLQSMGYGGMAAVVVSALAAVLVLPAVLAVLGPNIEKLRVRRRRTTVTVETHEGFWFRLAQSVMRRPGRILAASAAVLAILFIPFFGVKFGGIDQRVLAASAEPRVVSDTLVSTFGADPGHPIVFAVSLDQPADSEAGKAAAGAYLTAVQGTSGVTGAQITGSAGNLVRMSASFDGEPLGDEAKALVDKLREMPNPTGVHDVLIGGDTALVIDRLDSVGSNLPWMALLVALATFVLLFFAFGSVILPIKAILMNVLSLGASLGVVTWIFQDGHFSDFLGFTPTGYVEATQPILVLAIVFGLSMDYEVFLLARIREQWDLTHDNRLAVATGLQQTGRIISSAAMLIIVVIAAFSTSSISFIKLIGIAMLVAVIVDALLVRMFVVPAAMRLMGRANWWAPGPLRRFWERWGFKEELSEPAQTAVDGRPAARGDERPLADANR
jgi:trehalose monomycolate/heme transporter